MEVQRSLNFDFKIWLGPEKPPGLSRNGPQARKRWNTSQGGTHAQLGLVLVLVNGIKHLGVSLLYLQSPPPSPPPPPSWESYQGIVVGFITNSSLSPVIICRLGPGCTTLGNAIHRINHHLQSSPKILETPVHFPFPLQCSDVIAK